MILRPVSPVSPIGPPVTNLPVGLTSTNPAPSLVRARVAGDHRPQHVLDHVAAHDLLVVDVGMVLGRHQQPLDRHRPAVHIAHRHLSLAVGAQVGDHLGLARVGQAPGDPVGEHDRHRHQLGRLAAGVAEHHPLVTGSLRVGVALGRRMLLLVDDSTPRRMSGDCSSRATITPQVAASKPRSELV